MVRAKNFRNVNKKLYGLTGGRNGLRKVDEKGLSLQGGDRMESGQLNRGWPRRECRGQQKLPRETEIRSGPQSEA